MLWSARELSGAQFGDARLSQRLILLTEALAEHPESSIPEACGKWKETKAAYRFFDHEKVVPEKILEPHRKATLERLRGESVILAVQDTSVFNFTSHEETQGLGPIGAEGLWVFFVTALWPYRRRGCPRAFWAKSAGSGRRKKRGPVRSLPRKGRATGGSL